MLVQLGTAIGHLQPIDFVFQHRDQLAGRRLARHKHLAVVAAVEQGLAMIDCQSTLGIGRRVVTGIAMLDQHGANPRLKKFDLSGLRTIGMQRKAATQGHQNDHR